MYINIITSVTYICICRVVQLDYESTSALLLPNRNGNDGEDNENDDGDEYVVYLKMMTN